MRNTLILLVALLAGCATQERCFTAHSASLKITDSTGVVRFEKPSETVAYCPAWVGEAASHYTLGP